jgi:GT2 family glycosyltransferase
MPAGKDWTQRFAQRRVWSFQESARALERGCLEQGLAPTSPLSFAQRAQWAPFRASLAARPSAAPEISFLILNKDRPALLRRCVESIERESRVPFEILIGDTGSTDPEVLDFQGATPHRVVSLGHYQFSRGNNALAREARCDVLCLINNDVELISCDFAQACSSPGTRRGHGGGYLCYRDHRLQHAGVRICPSAPYRGVPEHFDRFAPLDGYPGLAGDRDVVAVTGAFLLIRRQLYRTLGGLDEQYLEEAQDAALCLDLWERGLRNVVSPALVAYHLENASRTVKESPADRQRLAARFGALIERRIYPWQAEHGLG